MQEHRHTKFFRKGYVPLKTLYLVLLFREHSVEVESALTHGYHPVVGRKYFSQFLKISVFCPVRSMRMNARSAPDIVCAGEFVGKSRALHITARDYAGDFRFPGFTYYLLFVFELLTEEIDPYIVIPYFHLIPLPQVRSEVHTVRVHPSLRV